MMVVKLGYGCLLKEAKERARFESLRSKDGGGEKREREPTVFSVQEREKDDEIVGVFIL